MKIYFFVYKRSQKRLRYLDVPLLLLRRQFRKQIIENEIKSLMIMNSLLQLSGI